MIHFARSRWFLLGSLCLLPSTSSADVIILKDGYTLHGKLTKEQTTIVDDLTGQPFLTNRVNSLNIIDDGPRWTIYSARAQQIGDVDNTNIFENLTLYRKKFISKSNHRLLKEGRFENISAFDPKTWRRQLVLRGPRYFTEIEQQVRTLSPHYVRLDSTTHLWNAYYLSEEFGPERIRELLATHPKLTDEEGKLTADGQFAIHEFFRQANWYGSAQQELEALGKAFPDQSERVDKAQLALREQLATQEINLIEKARNIGQHDLARRTLQIFPTNDIPVEVAGKVTAIKGIYETEQAHLKAVKQFLGELPQQISKPEEQFLVEAANVILAETNLDNINRLETFYTLADQAERDRARNRTVQHEPNQLLALAVSGWLLGANAAETNVTQAEKLWRSRAFVQKFLRTNLLFERRKLSREYQQSPYILPYDEFAEITRRLPPADPIEIDSSRFLKRKTLSTREHLDGVEYLLQLPPEYHHGRAYPVLIALHNAGEDPEAMLDRLQSYTQRHGYILACPRWAGRFEKQYKYSSKEHETVLATLLDLRRHVQVDSDRVFLTGVVESGTMALDIGCSHPDLFAGVIPMSPRPNWDRHMVEYWRNAQNLPVYIVMGNQMRTSFRHLRRVLEQWMPKGFPALTVLYKGRNAEWFSAEWDMIFDWMNRKRRTMPYPMLGVPGQGLDGLEYRSLRDRDNRFYWLSSAAIKESRLLENTPTNRPVTAARLQAKVHIGNLIDVNTFGVNQVTIWLTPTMVDFEQPIHVRLNREIVLRSQKLAPDIAVMLEDFYERGDRQNLFWQRIDLDVR